MQDIHAINGGGIAGTGAGGRFFGGVDRRIRSHSYTQQQPQSLKCPRCDSLNTKFCYYNNYNLAQPRHFCKSCRRYWTNGGVLRNVPVGGGLRKNKNNKNKLAGNNSKSAPNEGTFVIKHLPKPHTTGNTKTDEHSLSQAQALTTPPQAEPSAEITNTTSSSPVSASVFSNYTSDTQFFNSNSPLFSNRQIFPADIGGLETLIAPPQKIGMGLGLIEGETNSYKGIQGIEMEIPEIKGRMNGGNVTADWVNGGGLFDLTAAVDPAAYWSHPQWTVDADPPLNFFP